jgi:hypothetical protein
MRRPTLAHFYIAALLNLPFVLCHPAFPLLTEPLSRSLVINAVLFLVPGLPLAGILSNWRPLVRLRLLFVIGGSFAIFMLVLIAFLLGHIPVSAGGIWTTTWVLTNLLVVLNVVLGGKPDFIINWPTRRYKVGALLFVVAYITFYIGAVRIVPVTGDNDDEMQNTEHGLLTSLEPRCCTTRETTHYFSHPPLLHMCVAASFLYYDQWDNADLAVFDPGPNPSISSPREEYFRLMNQYYKFYGIETRTPNIFFAALTVACLGAWIAASWGGVVLAFLAALAYMLTPEVFVRSSYGGYFAIGNLILMGMALAEEERSQAPKQAWLACFLTGALAAVADHKLVVVIASLALWEALRLKKDLIGRAAASLQQPTVLGFAAGTALFWTYGLAVDAKAFWIDHVRYHIIDRIIHQPTPWQVASFYPGIDTLWLEFARDTGWLLLPLALAAFAILWLRIGTRSDYELDKEFRSTTGFWVLWTILTAVTFSVVDWRQTKHLVIMTLPLFLAPARAAARSRLLLLLIAVVFALLIAWNLKTILGLSGDFNAMHKLPGW